LKNSASGLFITALGGQQIAWGILKAHGLVNSNDYQNKVETLWVICAWFYGAVFGCRSAFLMKFSKLKVEV
jgi:hypothetical protein